DGRRTLDLSFRGGFGLIRSTKHARIPANAGENNHGCEQAHGRAQSEKRVLHGIISFISITGSTCVPSTLPSAIASFHNDCFKSDNSAWRVITALRRATAVKAGKSLIK